MSSVKDFQAVKQGLFRWYRAGVKNTAEGVNWCIYLSGHFYTQRKDRSSRSG